MNYKYDVCIVGGQSHIGLPLGMPETDGSPKRRLPYIEEAKSLFKYNKQYNLDEGLKSSLEWYKSNVFIKGGVSAL